MLNKNRVTVKDIASELNISLSTVNKAMTGKNGISEERRQEVLETAKKLGYRVNKVAQSLARNPLRIGILIPNDWPQFYKYIERGINIELERLLDFNVKGIFRYFSHKENADQTIIDSVSELIKLEVDAIILCPTYLNYETIFKKIHDSNIPLLLLGGDVNSYGGRLTCIRVNGSISGRMAAEIVRLFLPANKSAAVFIGNKDIEIHNEKVKVFIAEVNEKQLMKVAGVFETQDDPELAYYLTKKLLNEREDIGAIYVATGNSAAVCKCIEDNNSIGKVKVVATDIFKELIDYMDKGIVVAAIHQNSEIQGKLALRILYAYLADGKNPEDNTLVSPQIVLRSNIEEILND